MRRYMVQQWVEHAQQFEDLPEGDFGSADAAINAVMELADNCEFSDLRVVDTAGSVVFEQDKE